MILSDVRRERPLSRSSKEVEFNDGRKEAICWSPAHPEFFKDRHGTFNPIRKDRTHVEHNSKINADTLMRPEHVASVGIRMDGVQEKYLGIRPDINQETGEDQIEWTVISAQFDGMHHTIRKDTLVESSDKQKVTMGDLAVIHYDNGVRQAVKVPRKISDFKITYKLNLTGFKVINERQILQNEILRDAIVPTYTDLGDLTARELMSQFETPVSGLQLETCRITDRALLVGKRYKESLPQDTPQAYVIDAPAMICAAPVDESIAVLIRGYRGPKKAITDYFRDVLMKVLGPNVTYDSDTGYILDADGKPLSYPSWDHKNNVLCALIATKELDSFQQEFADVDIHLPSYRTNLGYTKFTRDYAREFEQGLTLGEVQLNGEYIIPDAADNFVLESHDEQVTYLIRQPKMLDKDFNVVSGKTLHTLRALPDGSYEYIKYPNWKALMDGDIEKAEYIDADTFYSGVYDFIAGNCPVDHVNLDFSGDSTWAYARNTRTSAYDIGPTDGSTGEGLAIQGSIQAQKAYDSKDTFQGYFIKRVGMIFDTSGIGNMLVKAGSIHIKSLDPNGGGNNRGVFLCFGTWDYSPLTAGAYNQTYWGGSTPTPICPVINAWTAGNWYSGALNFTGLNGINKSGMTKIAMRSQWDAENTAPTGSTNASMVFSMNAIGIGQQGTNGYGSTADRPYLSLTLEPPPAGTPVMMMF